MRLISRLFAALLCAAPTAAVADAYPTRVISMVVPFAAGGTSDVLARVIAEGMTRNLGQNVIIENFAGAGGRVGTERVIRSTPDGYTILFSNLGLAASKTLFRDVRYDVRTDLAAIGLVADVPMVLAVSNKSGFKQLSELLAHIKAKGTAMSFGTAGYGSTADMAPRLLLQLTKLNATIVSYRGAGPAIQDLSGGFVDSVIDQTPTLLPIHGGGLARALAVSAPQRLAQAPDIPTFAEAGLPEFNMQVWNAIAAPAATPKPVIERLAAALAAALDDPAVQARFNELGVPLLAKDRQGPAFLASLMAAEVDRWAEVLKDVTPPAQ